MLMSMNRAYLAILIFSSILAWASFFSIIFFTNPQSAGILGVFIVYVSLTVGLAGLIVFLVHLVILKKK